jgi:uncharacterized protein YbjT (DUF2867 family)
MVGQGALRACLAADDVERVACLGRSPVGEVHPRLVDIVHPDLFDAAGATASCKDYDACFFCLGVSASGLSEAEYSRLTFDLTTGIARELVKRNPRMVFVYVSGAGTDSSERGRTMWARVKGRTENALLAMGFRAACMLRPGIIQPLDGIRSKTGWYQALYSASRPLLPLFRRLAPNQVLTTRVMGATMLRLAREGGPAGIYEAAAINRMGGTD